MKRLLSVLLAVMMLLSLGSVAFAEEADQGITQEKVLQWLDEGEDAAESVQGQLANGALRLAEMVVAVNSKLVASEEENDRAEAVLDALAEVSDSDAGEETILAAGTIKALEALLLLANQMDREDKYEAYIEQIVDTFSAQNEQMTSGKGQAVNALYQSVRVMALLTEEHCTSEEMIQQVEAGLTQFAEDEEATVTADDQLANGARWLCKMTAALAKLLSQDSAAVSSIEEMMKDNETLDAQQDNAGQQAVIWLYGSVHMMGKLADALES